MSRARSGRHDDKAARGAGGSANCSGPRGGRARPTVTATNTERAARRTRSLRFFTGRHCWPGAEPQPDGDAPPARPLPAARPWRRRMRRAERAGGAGSSCRPVWVRVKARAQRAELAYCFRLCRARPSAKHGRGGCYGIEVSARARRERAGGARVVAEPDLGRAVEGPRGRAFGLARWGGVLAVPCLLPAEARACLKEVPL